MKILVDIDKFLNEERIDEAPTLTKQHYTWFLGVFADACKKNNLRKQIYLNLLETMMTEFAATNTNFKPTTFMTYAKKMYAADEEE
jgi:hypothetical protein